MKYSLCINGKVVSSYSSMKRAKIDYDLVRKVLESVIIGENVVTSISVDMEDEQ